MPSEVPLAEQNSVFIGTLVARDFSEMSNSTENAGNHASELKTLSNIGVKLEAGGEYVCIANNSRATSRATITLQIKGLCSLSVTFTQN